jgi:DNA-binding CsgD family transcriptional regulator
MSRLTTKDYRDTLDLVYAANRCQDVDSFINKLFPPLMRVFNTECATFQLLVGYPWHIRITESRSLKYDFKNISEDKVYPVLYKENYYQRSPLLKQATSSTKNIFRIGDSISYEEWDKSDLLNSFIRPQHLYWELFLTLRWRSNIQGMITLWRSDREYNFEDVDVYKAELLAPHLALAVNNILTVCRMQNLKKHFLSDNEYDNQGLLCLDHKFRPYFSNIKAREICLQLMKADHENSYSLIEDDLTVPLSVINDCSMIFHALKTNEPVLLSKDRVITTENGRKFHVECSMVWKADNTGSVPSYLVIMSDINNGSKKLDSIVPKGFNLSRREMDVIYYLVRGMSEEEIAASLCISKLTVHTHVKNIYKKLGAKSRIELYRNIRLQSSMLR